ncbi:uncharacterized protein TNCV_824781 [Trichonephila clavipes]|nr:uncharacterized protein TNCV_824781 [Trichonephila clavipes]
MEGSSTTAPHRTMCHMPHRTLDTFQQQVIRFDTCVEFIARSADLNPLDLCLWLYIKQRVFASLPSTVQELRSRFTVACASVSLDMLKKVRREMKYPSPDVYCC